MQGLSCSSSCFLESNEFLIVLLDVFGVCILVGIHLLELLKRNWGWQRSISVVLEQELLLLMNLVSVTIYREHFIWSILLLFHIVVDGALYLLSGDQVDKILSLRIGYILAVELFN